MSLAPSSARFRALGLCCAALAWSPACDPGGAHDSDSSADDASDDAAVGGGGKADALFGIEEDTPLARAILRVVNEASPQTLDDEVGLDRRAADGIVQQREADAPGGILTLAALDRVPYVGRAAFEKLQAYVQAEGLVGTPLKIATFNIRWFGLDGGLFGTIGSETRVDTVRAFIERELADRDVVVFEEIVDLDLFTEAVMPDHTCITYEGFTGKHQHVMLCHTDAFEFRTESDDDNYALEALKIGAVRPGLHGTLYTAAGQPVAHIIAVHLKADESSTARRLEQAQVLADRTATLRAASELPIITIGDFNTHLAHDTGLARNDEDLLADVLVPLSRVPLPVTFTYQEKDGTQYRLDQAFLSDDIVVDDVRAAGPCDLPLDTHAAEIAEYYDTVSDHCPLSFDLQLP